MFKILIASICVFALGLEVNGYKYRWCCKSAKEKTKCENLAFLQVGGQKVFDFNCVHGIDTAACVDKIINGNADVMTLDGGDVFFHRDNLKVIASENHNSADASDVAVGYYPLAAVKKGTLAVMNNVTSYSTCHTGIGKTAGWNMPMGWIKRNGLDASDITASCAPGANNDKYRSLLPGSKQVWCSLCVGDGQVNNNYKCERNQNELYYGYNGAFKCMDSGAGEVAFIKHTTIPSDRWSDFELLCGDGSTRKSPSEYASCNLGTVPPHALVANKDISNQVASEIYSRLSNAWNSFTSTQSSFYAQHKGSSNLLWGDTVKSFHDVTAQNVIGFLGVDYYCAIQNARGELLDSICPKSQDILVSSLDVKSK